MKNLLFLTLLISNIAFADCKVDNASRVTSTRNVGQVTSLSKDISPQKCTVKYRINVDNEWHNVTWSHSGYEDGEFLCNVAVDNGRKQLLTMLGGTIESESLVVCKEGNVPKQTAVKIGQEVLETELARVPEYGYFKYNSTTCRLFRERYNNGVLRVNHGVMCQADNQRWTVIDKW
jgi:hypothetical protein